MQERMVLPELMDDPNLEFSAHRQALQGLARINAWTSSADLIWEAIRSNIAKESKKHFSILDVATGSGDLFPRLQQKATRAGIQLTLAGCDVSEQALQIARQRAETAGVKVDFWKHDLLASPLPDSFDFVCCSQFLHHLESETVPLALQHLAGATERRLILVDLMRSRLNYGLVWFACRALSRSPIVHVDGPRSIRAAWTTKEITEHAQSAGLKEIRLSTHFPCRFRLVWDRPVT
ncbi:Methyltransferase [Planctomycetales bacterium 10988]|nr:Methyltransferase [Planctomycetales bacterium 10988]